MATTGRGTKATWYGHATFIFDTPGGKRVIIDPWVQGNPACPDNLKKVDRLDLILITHGHFDHIADVVQVARDSKPGSIVCIFEINAWLEKKGVGNLVGMNKGGTVEVEGIKVTMLHADHSCGIQDDDGSIIYGGEAVGFLIEMEDGSRIYHSGDTAIFGDMRLYGEMFAPDIAVLPIGDHFTMDPRQAAYAAEMLGVKRVIPSHYGTFPLLTGTPARLREELQKRNYECKVIDLEVGKPADL